ncbi:MAG TPA: DNA oxidative demethylase AlkB [Marinobacter sp.]|jgi:alkylated DNA repair protein (DNA oxidative demethylase)|nr:DNA oxidative demethylase AlkB [Marinobacter sp.]
MQDLFEERAPDPHYERILDGLTVLRQIACARADDLLAGICSVESTAPFRHMITPGGHAMSAAMTCCGPLGWVTDRKGYRYQSTDPESGQPWPAMPTAFLELARNAAAASGFPGFEPDACLINRYQRGARMGLHQDRDEASYDWPIVSVSLGLPVVFQFGGLRRSDRPQRIPLDHGDVVVWGGPARLNYHGVLTLKAGEHPLTGPYRFNLTFRRAG